jgi:hypothetical protein
MPRDPHTAGLFDNLSDEDDDDGPVDRKSSARVCFCCLRVDTNGGEGTNLCFQAQVVPSGVLWVFRSGRGQVESSRCSDVESCVIGCGGTKSVLMLLMLLDPSGDLLSTPPIVMAQRSTTMPNIHSRHGTLLLHLHACDAEEQVPKQSPRS